jgi:hypothetical protein
MSTQEEAVPVRTKGDADVLQPIIGPATHGLGEQLVREGDLKSDEAFLPVRDGALAIVSRLRPFADKPGRRTGLVVGYVQSGKTMSMTAVASLARDNGCRIVVLLAGVTTNLLEQNAERFKKTLQAAARDPEDWVFLSSAKSQKDQSVPGKLHQLVLEWRKPAKGPHAHRTLFIAVLKNHAHLGWLAKTLSTEDLSPIPALIFDDEADQAGLNVSADPEGPSRTHARIEEVRRALPNHSYVQYTATPQAPLLISIDDLLSPQFAELVEPGTGYVGGRGFFPLGTREHPHVILLPPSETIDAGEAPDSPPPKMLDALATFFVGCAIARHRGSPKLCSMLIHPSQRKDDHKAFMRWTEAIQRRWSETLLDENDEDRGDTLKELRVGYDELLKTNPVLPAFEDIEGDLEKAVTRVQMKTVNSEEGSEIDWSNGREHILVGGEKLNRGYTVKGLTVTYMPRNPGGWNADTIQQRARFFGYKADYLSICRVYLHPDVHRAYSKYVVHEDDMRRQLAEHRGRPLREWRRAFLLDARLKPTRSNVLSEPLTKVKADRPWFVQSYPHIEPDLIAENDGIVERFLERLTFTASEEGSVFRGLPVAETTLDVLLDGLLVDYRTGAESATFYAHLVTLANERNADDKQRVLVVKMQPDGELRARSPEKGTGKLTLQQGKSAGKNGNAGDKAAIEPGVVTLQLHHVRVKESDQIVWALALYSPKTEDAIAQGYEA